MRFLELSFFITIVPINKFIAVIVIIVIMSYFYLLLCYKPIRDKLQRRRIIFYCFLTHFLCFNYYFIAHFLHPKMIRDRIYHVWTIAHRLVAHLLCFKMVRDKCKWMWFFAHYLIIHFLGHWKIFSHVQQDGAQRVIDDIPEFIFKQVNHFYSYTWLGEG